MALRRGRRRDDAADPPGALTRLVADRDLPAEVLAAMPEPVPGVWVLPWRTRYDVIGRFRSPSDVERFTDPGTARAYADRVRDVTAQLAHLPPRERVEGSFSDPLLADLRGALLPTWGFTRTRRELTRLFRAGLDFPMPVVVFASRIDHAWEASMRDRGHAPHENWEWVITTTEPHEG